MANNNMIDRSGAQALIPEDAAREIIQNVPQSSTIMRMAKKLPNLSRKQRRIPVVKSLASAYFVNGDTGSKQTTDVSWDNIYLDAEEIAVIVPIPEAVLDDQDYDIWGEVRPMIEEAFGVAFDKAVLYGINAPASWPDDLFAQIVAHGHNVDLSNFTDMYEAIMSESTKVGNVGDDGIFMTIEADGFMHTGHILHPAMKGKLRGLRDTTGQPLLTKSLNAGSQYDLDGSPSYFPTTGIIDVSKTYGFTGDWSKLVYGIRTDITYKMLTEAVIQDANGDIVYNLAQQDMVALRAVMRLGWALPNIINRMNEDEATRFPFAALVP